MRGTLRPGARRAQVDTGFAPVTTQPASSRAPGRRALRTALAAFLATRLVVVLGAWMGVSRLVAADSSHYRGPFVEAALLWDGGWYAGIAREGYSIPPAPALSNLAFPPLLPMLIRGVAWIFSAFGVHFGDPGWGNWALAGFLVSNAAFVAALYLLWKLVAMDHGYSAAGLTVWLVAALPLGVFWSAVYTESLFLLLAVGGVMAARRGIWPAAGALAGLAALTRWAGVVLVGVLLVEWISARRYATDQGAVSDGMARRASLSSLFWLGLAPVAMGVYAAYLQSQFGSPWVVFRVQAERWQHKLSFFVSTYYDSVNLLWQHLSHSGPRRDEVGIQGSGNSLYMWLDLGLPLLFVVLGVLGWRRGWLRPGDIAWLALGILFPLSSDNTRSLARYLLPLWPAMIVAARLSEKYPALERAWLVVSTGLAALVAYIFGSGNWIG